MTASYNGWPASEDRKALGIVPLVVAGVSFVPGCKAGPVHEVFTYVLEQWHQRVEPLGEGCWGYAYRKNRNADNLSCHASGTAVDVNAPKHPNGQRNTYLRTQVREARKILAEVDGVVKWGEDFGGTVDGMHLEIAGTPEQVAAVAARLRTRGTDVPQEDDIDEKTLRRVVEETVEALVLPRLAEMVETITGGKRARDAQGQVIDVDKDHISSADVMTKVERVGDYLVSKLGPPA